MRRYISFILSLLLIASLLFIGFQKSGPIQAFAANIMSREAFLAMTPYGVAEAHDTDTSLRKSPAIYWGMDGDGTVTFATGTYQNSFNASCSPIIMLQVLNADDTSTTLFTTSVKTLNSTGFTYEARQSANDSETDVTASVSVLWVAFGWR